MALAAALLLVATACGARLSSAQKQAGIDAIARKGGGTIQGTTGTALGGGTTTGGLTGPGVNAGGGTTGGTGDGTTGIGAPIPPGGNGGATDTGVTANQIVLATASDVTGVQPGLFKSTMQAMSALAAMVNSQGGLFGRAIKPLLIDTKADSTANAAAVRQACDQAFALVGSMSAFDDGGASVGEDCGIPDITAIAVNPSRALAKNVIGVDPVRPDKFVIGTANYMREKFPAETKHAAMLYLNAGVTRVNATQRKKAYETAGFHFDMFTAVNVLEANYKPIVQDMKNKGIEYVNMVANYQAIQKLLQAMEEVPFYPKVRDWDSVAYSPNFLVQNNKPFTPANGSFVFLNTAISEEISSNPEMQLYVSWLNRVAPGAKPDFFGFYAWSAGRLFVKVHQTVGAKITRKAFMAALKQVHSWDGNGLHARHDVGNKLSSPCFMYLEVRNGKFVRKDPASGFMCDKGGVINT